MPASFSAVSCKDGVIYGLTFADPAGLIARSNPQGQVLFAWDTRTMARPRTVSARYRGTGASVTCGQTYGQWSVIRGNFMWWTGPDRLRRTDLRTGVTGSLYKLACDVRTRGCSLRLGDEYVFALKTAGTGPPLLYRDRLAVEPDRKSLPIPALGAR